MAAVFGGLQGDNYDRQYSDSLPCLSASEIIISEHKRQVILGLLGFPGCGDCSRALRPVYHQRRRLTTWLSGGDVFNFISDQC